MGLKFEFNYRRLCLGRFGRRRGFGLELWHRGFKFEFNYFLKVNGEVKVKAHNLMCTVGLQAVADALIDAGVQFDTGATYCAIGTGNTAPSTSDTVLTTEAGTRQSITTRTRAGLVLTFSTFFTAAQSNIAIEEVGLFGTSTASGAADSGVIFNHALLSYDNSGASPNDVTIDCEVTISEV